MPEPMLLGHPLSTLILYFIVYSFAGWLMETTYCSILERRLVPRGFLHGPLCPIYGVGVLLMILFFEPLAGNLFVFYLVSTVTMSAWEYFVGWFLEVTTHMKYWDYSMHKFNLKGRICLWVCLVWGALSYVCIFWLHPPIANLIARIPLLVRQILALGLFAAVIADAVATIRELALMTKALEKLQTAGGELQLQMALGRAELNDKLQDWKETAEEKLDDWKETAGEKITGLKEDLSDAREAFAAVVQSSREAAEPSGKNLGDSIKDKYADLVANAEKRSRRFRSKYTHLSAPKVEKDLDKTLREVLRQRTQQVIEEKKAKRQAKKDAKKAK